MNKTIKSLAVALATAATIAIPFSTEAHWLSSAQEKEIGNQAVADYIKEYQCEHNWVLDHIQERIMMFNSDKLWMFGTPGKKRGLEPVLMVKNNVASALSYGGGQIFIYEGMFDHLATKRSGAFSYDKNDQTPWKKTNIYQMSALAAVMGHEMAIWDNEAILDYYDKQIIPGCFGPPSIILWHNFIQKENVPDRFSSRNLGFTSNLNADRTAMEYLAYVPEYSVGGEAIVQYRNYQYKILRGIEDKVQNWSNPKSKVTKRLKGALEYQEELSKGFVKWNGFSPTFNGNTKCGEAFLYSDAKRDFDAVERGFYVVGQISSAIHFDFCKQKNITIKREDEVFTDGSPDNVVMLLEGRGNDLKDHTKIIDTYYGVSVQDAKFWAESTWDRVADKYNAMIQQESELANLTYTRGIIEQYENNRARYKYKQVDDE